MKQTNLPANYPRGVTVRMDDHVFHIINKQSAVHKMKLGEFVNYIVACYAQAVEQTAKPRSAY